MECLIWLRVEIERDDLVNLFFFLLWSWWSCLSPTRPSLDREEVGNKSGKRIMYLERPGEKVGRGRGTRDSPIYATTFCRNRSHKDIGSDIVG